jgi:hypothetical protein
MNSSRTTSQVLLLGLADSGKTTYLIQFFGRLKSGSGELRTRGAPRDLSRIEAGLSRLNQGLTVEHTPVGHEFTQILPAQNRLGTPVEIALPDYSGEDLRSVVKTRRLPVRWRELARTAEHWLLLTRLSQQARRPDVLTSPVGVLATKAWTDKEADPDQLPLDMWGVELLQILWYARAEIGGNRVRPRMTLVLSCWDELDDVEGKLPRDVAHERLALLDSYCSTHWPSDKYRVIGLSSQGTPLDRQRPSEDFVDRGPEHMGWLILPDGSRDPDLTLLAAVD